ncbi:MAG TPA: hypothetical protein VK826_05570 [Bacteroidia bacterium]|nr:hypothetical protein [Bacteroidia bacterium]
MKLARKYQTLLVIVAGLIVIWYFNRSEVLLFAAIIVGIAGALVPACATGIDWLWNKTGKVLGAVMSPVMLTVFFFCFLTPFALIRRIFGRSDAMLLKGPGTTTWKKREHLFVPKDISDPW